MNKTIVIKIGTNILTTEEDFLDLNNLRDLSYQIADEVNTNNTKIILVSSGAITSGKSRLRLTTKTIQEKQALASVGQILLLDQYLKFFNIKGLQIGQLLLTKDNFKKTTLKNNILNTLNKLIDNKVIPIINENDTVATDEIKNFRFGDNDELSSLVAKLVKADLLVLLTDTDGLFTANPKNYADAKLIPYLESVDSDTYNLIEDTPNCKSRGGMCSKIKAAADVSNAGIPTIIASGRTKNILKNLFQNPKNAGTYIAAKKGAH
ncbi:MAG: glutamate 5-kinase [Candidatus Margulisiibacteriota bacterium]|jgi:glutamate 5-kinase